MRGFNRVIIMGNLARDPDVRYTVDKRVWARFSVAVNYRYKNQSGEWQDGVDFLPVVAWGNLAENCGRYLKKGSGIFVEGQIRTGSYEARDGSGKRYTTDIIASTIQFVGGRGSSEGGSGSYSAPPPEGRPTSFSGFSGADGDDGFGQSISDRGFGDDFPMDISESDLGRAGKSDADGRGGNPEADIPF